jgi:predicted PurR-regulated permease PerM
LGLARWMVLLILLSFICAMIPMLGAPVVWLPLSAWLIYQQQYVAGVSLALIGMLIVSNVDNLVRMLVLRGSAGLHPLLALVSVLGGIQQMGMIGAFIGPVVVGVFVTLLRILKQQLDTFEIASTPPDEPHSTAKADDLRDHLPR